MNRGERIWKTLRDPDRHDIAATEWLLLYAISKRNGTTSKIQDKMTSLWKKINAHDSSFYLVFPRSNDGHNCTSLSLEQGLGRLYEIGIVHYDKNLLWSLTEKGIKVLNEQQPQIQKRIPSIKYI